MIKTYTLITIVLFLILGCKISSVQRSNLIQNIDTLEMDIYSNDGKKLYSIKSPNSIYDRDKNTFILESATINLFKDQKVKYIISSNNSKLTNNNSRLELNGRVKLKILFEDNDLLIADNFRWDIKDTKYLLNGNVKFENSSIILKSNKALLSKDNIIEFYNPVKYIIKNNDNKISYEINSENAFYNIITKSVSFKSNNKRVRSKIIF